MDTFMDTMLLFPKKWFAPPDCQPRLVRDEIDYLCQNTSGPFIAQKSGEDPAPAFPVSSLLPSARLAIAEDAYILSIELPGVAAKDVTVELCGRNLLVYGTKNKAMSAGCKTVMDECIYGSFCRVWNIPADANPDALSIRHENGVIAARVGRKKSETAGKEGGMEN